jgi:AcrR family transcriptional regulator
LRIEAQRQLLLEAMVGAAAAKGYEACRVEDVLGRSGLSRSTFYLHFTDKTDCFMAAFERAAQALFEAVMEAVEAAADPQARAEAAVEALLGSLVGDPAIAQLTLVGIRTAGPEGRERYAAACERFASLLAGGGCLSGVVPGMEMEQAERAVDSVATVLWLEVGSGRTEGLQRLAPALVAVIRR